MPACFQLTPKDSQKPEPLAAIDDKMREHFKAPPDKKSWYLNWYNIEGLYLAIGHSLEELHEQTRKDDTANPTEEPRLPIVEWLFENYTAYSWRG